MQLASTVPRPSEQFSMERWLANPNPSRIAPHAQTCTSTVPLTLVPLLQTTIHGQQRTSCSTSQWLATPPAQLAPSRQPTPCKRARPAALVARMPAYHKRELPTTAAHVLSACQFICAQDPWVKGTQAGRAAKASGLLIKSANVDDILHRWEMAKLIAMLPEQALCKLAGLNALDFQRREPADIAAYIFGKAGAVAADNIRKGRHALTRMLAYMKTRDLCFDDSFGTLPEVDLYGFLLTVHRTAMLNGTDRRPGFTAVWGVFDGLVYLKHFKFPLPTDEVRNALPQRGKKTGAGALLEGVLALPPEALQAMCDYDALQDTPQVLASYTYALIISTLGSLRQVNAQHICLYGEVTVGSKTFLLVQHADGKSRGNVPTLALILLEDMRESRLWFDRNKHRLWKDSDFLWAESDGPPGDPASVLLPCPLDATKIQSAIRLVLQQVCSMSAVTAGSFTKHSARKTMVSVAQAAGCPWEQCLELGHWSSCSLDSTFLLPLETLHRKRALETMSLPKRYSANARIARVARILNNQIQRMRTYLNHPQVLHRRTGDWLPKWHLIPPYDPQSE